MYNRKTTTSSSGGPSSTSNTTSTTSSKRPSVFSSNNTGNGNAIQRLTQQVTHCFRHSRDNAKSWLDGSQDDKLPKWLTQRRRTHPRDLLTKSMQKPKQWALLVVLCLCLCLTHQGIRNYDLLSRTTPTETAKLQRKLQRNTNAVPNMTNLDTVSPFTIRDFYQGEHHVTETHNVDWVKHYIDFHNDHVFLDESTWQWTLKPGTRFLKFCWCCPPPPKGGLSRVTGKWFFGQKNHAQQPQQPASQPVTQECRTDATMTQEFDGIMTAFYVAVMTERVLIIDGPNNANRYDRDYNEVNHPLHMALRKLLRVGAIHWAVQVYPEPTVHKTIAIGDKRSEPYLHDLCVVEPHTLGIELHTSQWFDDEWVWNSRCMQLYLEKIHTSHPHHTSLVHHHEHAAKHPKHHSHLYRPHLYRWAFWTIFKFAGLVIDKADDVRTEVGLSYVKPKTYDEYPRTFGGFFPPPLETPAPTEALPPPPLPPDDHQMEPQLPIPPDYRPYVASQLGGAVKATVLAGCTQDLVDQAYQMVQADQTFVDIINQDGDGPKPHRSLFVSHPLPEKRKQLEERMHQMVETEPGKTAPAFGPAQPKELPNWTWEWDEYYKRHTDVLGMLAELVIFIEAECIVLAPQPSSGHWSDVAAKISISNLGTLERCAVPMDVCESGDATHLAAALRTLYWSKHHHSIVPHDHPDHPNMEQHDGSHQEEEVNAATA